MLRLVLSSALLCAPATLCAQADGSGLGLKVREIFASKCVECHGSDLPKPKGKFGYVLDLEKVAKKYTAPKYPENSELYTLLTDENPKDRMPPPVAKNGPLTDEQIDVVRRWIAEGSPAPPSLADAGRGGGGTADPADYGSNFGGGTKLLRNAGRMHPMIVHFPIALVFAAMLADLIRWRWRKASLKDTRRFCLLLAAPSAIAAAAAGWLAGEYGGMRQSEIALHRWFGVATAAATLLVTAAGEWFGRKGRPTPIWLFPGALVVLSLLVALTGHFGGLLVNDNPFSWE